MGSKSREVATFSKTNKGAVHEVLESDFVVLFDCNVHPWASATGSPANAQTTATSPPPTKRLIADYGYWSQTQTPPYSSAQIPYNELTHINHAGVSFDANGNLIVPFGLYLRQRC